MTRMTVSLPAELKAFVDAEAVARGCASAADYIRMLVQKAHLEKHRKRVEVLLMEGLNGGPATPMAARDWEDIEQQGLARLLDR